MKNGIDYKTLENFSKGKYSYNDYKKVKHWYMNIKNDTQTEAKLFEQWKKSANDQQHKSMQSIFEKIHYQILLEEKKGKRKISIWHYYHQVAAILIPFFIISALAYFVIKSNISDAQNWVEINVPEGARIEFVLPDSTSGWLNSGAKLRYPPVFKSHRQVELIGEAFFKVKHLNRSDFTVSVADMDIKVLGTQFNVSAYADEASTEVVLKEGKIEAIGKLGKFNKILNPGEKIEYNHKNKTVEIKKVNPSLYLAWKDGYLVIDNEPLEQAARKIERWYNTEISIEDDVLKNFRFKATFADEPLEEVLRLIAMTTPISYEIEKRNINTTGIVNKKQVRIMLKQ